MEHSLPHAFSAWGKFVFDVRSSTKFFLSQLYQLEKPSDTPLTDNPKKQSRNDEIRQRYADGESVPDLAKHFGISKTRIYQIPKGKRK